MATPDDIAAAALARIEAAFNGRAAPEEMSDSMQLSDAEYDEVMAFAGMRWQDLGFDLVERNADAIFWFSPAAFAFYLPGFLAAGICEGRTDSNAYDAIVGMLDRSPEPDWWDDFFCPRWALLTTDELEAVAAWVDWLRREQADAFHPNSYDRARATLALLRDRSAG
jgi:hypothetical protein